MTKLRNRVNWLAGIAIPSGAFLLALVTDLGSLLSGMERVLWILGFSLASLGAYVVLGRPFVVVLEDEILVRNPKSFWRIPHESIDSVIVGSSGFPKVQVEGRGVRLWALEESLAAQLLGGFEKIDRVRDVASSVSKFGGRTTPEYRSAPFDKGAAFIALAWVAYYTISVIHDLN